MIGTVIQWLNGRMIMAFHMKRSGARMPLICPHWNTPCSPANDAGLDHALSAMAGNHGHAE